MMDISKFSAICLGIMLGCITIFLMAITFGAIRFIFMQVW